MPSLEALLASDIEVVAAVTNPDRPAGRGMKLTPPPLKRRALEAGLDVLQPARARDPELHRRLTAMGPDVAVVVAYGRILPPELLAVPRLGFVNLHFSLLPKYRGAAPVQRAIMAGDAVTGLSIMVLTAGMDEGPVLASTEEPIAADDTAGTLGERLARRGAKLLVEALGAYVGGRISPVEQEHAHASYAAKVTNQEARLSWDLPARSIHDHVRALNPVPGAWTTLQGRRLKVHATKIEPGKQGVAPGAILDPRAFVVAASEDVLRLTDVQLEGKRRMAGDELMRGLRLSQGDHLE